LEFVLEGFAMTDQTVTIPRELPPLPKASHIHAAGDAGSIELIDYYTAAQMREYAEQATQNTLSQQPSTIGCQLEPLTENKIWEEYGKLNSSTSSIKPIIFARAIEAAHGIGVTNG
jgi:hypothetical protein